MSGDRLLRLQECSSWSSLDDDGLLLAQAVGKQRLAGLRPNSRRSRLSGRAGPSLSLRIDDALGDGRKRTVGGFLFRERRLERTNHGILPEQSRVSDGRAVRGDLVVFDALSGADDGRIAHTALLCVIRVVVAFADQPLHAGAGFSLGFFAERGEGLLQPDDML